MQFQVAQAVLLSLLACCGNWGEFTVINAAEIEPEFPFQHFRQARQASEGYVCAISDAGKRIHEGPSRTPYDCKDSSGGNTCKGGQCVAYVKCKCTRNGAYPPQTSLWRPGTKLTLPNGRCNSNVPVNTAIATFRNGRYYAGHAAVFVGCSADKTRINIYDQYCRKSVGYNSYATSSTDGSNFHVITSPGSQGPRSLQCRIENAGPTATCKS